MPVVIDRFNDNIICLSKKQSRIIILSDIFEAKHDSKFYRSITSLTDMDRHHQTYIRQYGFGLGDYGLHNLEGKLKKLDHKWFEWPFDKGTSLFVKTKVLKN